MIKSLTTLSILLFLISCEQTPTLNGSYAYKNIETQVEMGPRNPGSRGHIQVTKWIFSELKKTKATIKFQPFKWTDKRFNQTYSMNNIIASYYPEKKNRILLAAHFDTNPIAEKDPIDSLKMKPILGANDGASGVAILLEIAKIIAQKEPTYGVDIVFFDGEDLGDKSNPENYCIGSKEFAKRMKDYIPTYGILLDLVGDKNAVFRYELNSYFKQPRLVEKIWDIAHQLGYESIFIKEKGNAISDDHIPLLEVGIPIIDIVDMGIIDNRDQIHHTHNDVIDHISPNTLEKVGTVVLNLVYE